jgi:hypothetical protein
LSELLNSINSSVHLSKKKTFKILFRAVVANREQLSSEINMTAILIATSLGSIVTTAWRVLGLRVACSQAE